MYGRHGFGAWGGGVATAFIEYLVVVNSYPPFKCRSYAAVQLLHTPCFLMPPRSSQSCSGIYRHFTGLQITASERRCFFLRAAFSRRWRQECNCSRRPVSLDLQLAYTPG